MAKVTLAEALTTLGKANGKGKGKEAPTVDRKTELHFGDFDSPEAFLASCLATRGAEWEWEEVVDFTSLTDSPADFNSAAKIKAREWASYTTRSVYRSKWHRMLWGETEIKACISLIRFNLANVLPVPTTPKKGG